MANTATNESSTEPAKINYKQQLDRAATGESASTLESATKLVDTVIDKVTDYIPATSDTLDQFHSQSRKDEVEKKEADAAAAESKSVASEASAEPERPHHDAQIEEFLREQHRSKQSDDLTKAVKGFT